MSCFLLRDYFRLSKVCFCFLIVLVLFFQLFDHLNIAFYIILLLYLVLHCFLDNAMVVKPNQSNIFYVLYFLTFMYTHLTASLIRMGSFDI